MGLIIHGNLGSDKTQEQDTVGCSHCQAVVLVAHYVKQGGWCWGCGKALCYPCAERTKIHGCRPWQQEIDELVTLAERDAALRRGGLIVGD